MSWLPAHYEKLVISELRTYQSKITLPASFLINNLLKHQYFMSVYDKKDILVHRYPIFHFCRIFSDHAFK
jgi:hypothetical protein